MIKNHQVGHQKAKNDKTKSKQSKSLKCNKKVQQTTDTKRKNQSRV